MIPNFLVLLGAAFVPFLIAMIWFSPKLFGGENWNRIAEIPASKSGKPVKPAKLILSILLNYLLSLGIWTVCVHPSGAVGMVSGDFEALKTGVGGAFMKEYAMNNLNFGHGFFHGIFPSLMFFVLPILGYVTIFERKSTKYLLVNIGYWLISLCLMGGIICQWGWMLV